MRMSSLVVLVALSWGRFCLRNGQVTAQMAVSPAPAGPLSSVGLRPRSRRFHRYLVYRWQRPGPLRTATRHAVQVAKLRLSRVLTFIGLIRTCAEPARRDELVSTIPRRGGDLAEKAESIRELRRGEQVNTAVGTTVAEGVPDHRVHPQRCDTTTLNAALARLLDVFM